MSSSLIEAALHRLLTHPVSVAAKRPVKDALWWIRGRGLANPRLDRVSSVLFVCKGNICRSPFAALRFEQLLAARDIRGIRCASAGIETTQANRSPKEACIAADAFGVELRSHVPAQLTSDLMDAYDLVVVMEASQLFALRARYAAAVRRIWLLSLLDDGRHGYDRYNIADPFGRSLEDFRTCYSRVEQTLEGLLGTLVRSLSPGPATSRINH